MAIFDVSGPYRVPLRSHRNGGREIDLAAVKSQRREDEEFEKILAAKGVYVFSIRAGRGSRPWYVGKSERSNFLNEAFNTRNLVNLNRLICDRKGTLEITFIFQKSRPGAPNIREIGEIEYFLIGLAKYRNNDLLNVHGTKSDTFVIQNIYNSGAGRRSKAQSEFGDLIGW